MRLCVHASCAAMLVHNFHLLTSKNLLSTCGSKCSVGLIKWRQFGLATAFYWIFQNSTKFNQNNLKSVRCVSGCGDVRRHSSNSHSHTFHHIQQSIGMAWHARMSSLLLLLSLLGSGGGAAAIHQPHFINKWGKINLKTKQTICIPANWKYFKQQIYT